MTDNDNDHAIKIKTINEPENPWARISEIAARLGVEPITDGRPGVTIVACGADQQRYDMFEIIVAFLDRVDAVSRQL